MLTCESVARPTPADPISLTSFGVTTLGVTTLGVTTLGVTTLEALSATAAAVDEPQETLERWMRGVESEAPCYSIRLPAPAREVDCPGCGVRFRAAGATGFADDRPICDGCLFGCSQPLGMLLALAAVARLFGGAEPVPSPVYGAMLDDLTAFTRVYARFAEQWGPLRPFLLDRLLEELDEEEEKPS
jgi:hypothetical protein